MINPTEFVEELAAHDIDLFCGVPDSLLKDFCACISQPGLAGRNTITANEGNAVGMACGYHLASGRAALVYMQNSGQGNAVNLLLSIADPGVYSMPMMLLVGWRGQPGVSDEPQHVKQGKVTTTLLEAMDIDYRVLGDNWRSDVQACARIMWERSKPVALVVPKGTFEAFAYEPAAGDAPLLREEALEVVLGQLGSDDFVVSTTGKTSREVFEIRERRGQGHDHDFLTVGGMGHTSSIAFGMALGTDKNVWCIDGDGAFLMHMGASGVIAQNAPDNFKYILNNNGAHESVGGQPTVGMQIDAPGVLRACGFHVVEVQTEDQLVQGVQALRSRPRSALVITTRQGSRADLGRPTTTPLQNKDAIMDALGSRGRD